MIIEYVLKEVEVHRSRFAILTEGVSANRKESDPFQFYRISFVCIPLTNVNVFIPVYTNVVAMLKVRLFLNHELKFALDIYGLSAARIRDYFIITIKDG